MSDGNDAPQPASASTSDEPDLKRVIGVWGVAFTAFNCTVGAGIFGLPALVAALLGPAAILAYLVCAVLIGLVCLCLAEAGSRVAASGGVYAYASAAFGPVVGGVAGSLFLFAASIGSNAALARFFLDTLAILWPPIAQPVAGISLLVAIYAALAWINIRGAKSGARLSIFMGFAKLTPLILLVLAGLVALQPANLAWPAVPPVAKIGEGALILFFAFIGLEAGLNVSGETRNPARTIPRAIALALSAVALLYIGLQTATQGVLGPALATSAAPVVDTASAVFGPAGAQLFLVMILVSVGGFLVADMLASPRIGYALAESGQLPRVAAYVHPRYRTPSVAIICYAALSLLLAASGTFRQITIIAVAGTLILYLICCLGVLRLRARNVAEAGPPFVAPGGPFVPIAAAAIILWLLSTLAWTELAAALAFVAVTAAIFAIGARRKARLRT